MAATEFAPSYRRATVMQATLAAVGLVASTAAWLAGASFLWVVAGLLLGSVIPFTLIVILPTNKQLLSPARDRRPAETERLLARWGTLMEAGLFLGQLHYQQLFYLYGAISLVLGIYLTYGGFKSTSH